MSKTRRSDGRFPEKEGKKMGARPSGESGVGEWLDEDESELEDDEDEEEDDDWEPEWPDEEEDLRASGWDDDLTAMDR